MTLWAKYSAEIGGPTFIEYDWGFVSYESVLEGLLVVDCYVIPEERGKGRLRQLLADIEGVAFSKGIDKIYCKVQDWYPNKEERLGMYFKLGFKIHSMNQRYVTLVKG